MVVWMVLGERRESGGIITTDNLGDCTGTTEPKNHLSQLMELKYHTSGTK